MAPAGVLRSRMREASSLCDVPAPPLHLRPWIQPAPLTSLVMLATDLPTTAFFLMKDSCWVLFTVGSGEVEWQVWDEPAQPLDKEGKPRPCPYRNRMRRNVLDTCHLCQTHSFWAHTYPAASCSPQHSLGIPRVYSTWPSLLWTSLFPQNKQSAAWLPVSGKSLINNFF